MTYIPSVLLAGVVAYVLSDTTHGIFGTSLGAFVDLTIFIAILYFTNKFLRKLRDG